MVHSRPKLSAAKRKLAAAASHHRAAPGRQGTNNNRLARREDGSRRINREYPVTIDSDTQGEFKRGYIVRMQVENGVRVRFAVSLQVRDLVSGRLKEIARYDDFRGFHRHLPPDPDVHEWLEGVPEADQVRFAIRDIALNADKYANHAQAAGYEAPEDEE